ncbi:sigma-70 family RNA polymerase sigma factor [Chitinophaga barathri]|uniref:Sigma-70 family RNA polymerase sigma factor n=2 Tax=Chitinophaga barathri TaxID=1647451 RepID=A0A3N4M975_9BACT|nr:sigma-70 family RNA polymerase sigma factor [Chitinophaga barathri]
MSSNDQSAFRALYEKYHHALYRRVFQLVRSSAESEDILQEVFITFWEKRRELCGHPAVGGWLFTVTFNRTVNHLKKKLREKHREQAAVEIAETPVNLAETEAQWKVLEEAIGQLSPQKRKVFQLCKLEGKTYEEASQLMGISRYTVKEYLGEVMRAIRDYVRQHPPYDTSFMLLLFLEIFL